MLGLFKKKIELASPMTGEAVELARLDDPVFSQGMVGDGIAVIPTSGEVVAPCDGKITQMFDTGHAVGIAIGDVEILIHIGMDTVELKGEGFKKIAKVGDTIKRGDPIIRADLEKIKSLGKTTDTPLIITEPAGKALTKHYGNVKAGETIVIELK